MQTNGSHGLTDHFSCLVLIVPLVSHTAPSRDINNVYTLFIPTTIILFPMMACPFLDVLVLYHKNVLDLRCTYP
jgi:hypothetical protein